MSEFSEIEAFINDYRSKHPRTRYYPKEFWVRVLPLAREHGAAKVATAFGISKQHLFKKLRQSSEVKDTPVRDPDVEFPPSFVQVPLSSSGRQITLELPHQIKLSIQL